MLQWHPGASTQPGRVFLPLRLGLSSSGWCLALIRERRCAWSVLAPRFSGDGGAVPCLSTGRRLIGETGWWVPGLSRQPGLGVSGGSETSNRGCVTVAKEPPSASVPGRVMGSACPVRPHSRLVTRQPRHCAVSPSIPTGVAGPHCAAVCLPSPQHPAPHTPSTPCTQQPIHPTHPAPCTHSAQCTQHPMHPAPCTPGTPCTQHPMHSTLRTQHPAHPAPSACGTLHNQRPVHLAPHAPSTLRTQHSTHPPSPGSLRA